MHVDGASNIWVLRARVPLCAVLTGGGTSLAGWSVAGGAEFKRNVPCSRGCRTTRALGERQPTARGEAWRAAGSSRMDASLGMFRRNGFRNACPLPGRGRERAGLACGNPVPVTLKMSLKCGKMIFPVPCFRGFSGKPGAFRAFLARRSAPPRGGASLRQMGWTCCQRCR